MARELQPECDTNPKTGKPFTRHSYEQRNLRVLTYYVYTGWPAAYGFDLVCKRCGYTEGVTY